MTENAGSEKFGRGSGHTDAIFLDCSGFMSRWKTDLGHLGSKKTLEGKITAVGDMKC